MVEYFNLIRSIMRASHVLDNSPLRSPLGSRRIVFSALDAVATSWLVIEREYRRGTAEALVDGILDGMEARG